MSILSNVRKERGIGFNQTVDFFGGIPGDMGTAEAHRSMSDVVLLIERFAGEGKLFVAIDEFHEVKKLESCDQCLAVLRSRIQLLQDTCFVFSGSVRDGMLSIYTDPTSAFCVSALTLGVPSIPDEDFPLFAKSGKRFENMPWPHRLLAF